VRRTTRIVGAPADRATAGLARPCVPVARNGAWDGAPRRRAATAVVFTVVAFLASAAAAPPERATVVLASGERLAEVLVVEESWERVRLDTDRDGRADRQYGPGDVKSIRYAKEPSYVLEARLHKDVIANAPKAISLYEQAYDDRSLSPWHKQHIYHEAAAVATRWAAVDPKWRETARRIRRRLVTDIPRSRYRVSAEFWLADDAVRRGAAAEATARLRRVADGGFGGVVRDRALVGLADVQVSAGEIAAADRSYAALLGRLKPDDPLWAAAQLGRAECALRGPAPDRDRLVRARRTLYDALPRVTADAERARLYRLLGDADRLAGRPAEALLHYLRAVLLYGGDDRETARALCGAVRCDLALKRPDRVRRHVARLKREFADQPGVKALLADPALNR